MKGVGIAVLHPGCQVYALWFQVCARALPSRPASTRFVKLPEARPKRRVEYLTDCTRN